VNRTACPDRTTRPSGPRQPACNGAPARRPASAIKPLLPHLGGKRCVDDRRLITGILTPFLPKARELIADRGYDSNPFRARLAERGISACIPTRKTREQPSPHDKALYR